MGEEIQDARRTMPRAVVAAAVIITLLYLAGTLEHPAGDPEGTDLGTAGHHAGDAGDDDARRRRVARADRRRRW